ncbi:hypothetical protein ACWT_1721 [Actinoplanes sp. SE50]|uniref:hypothetical protein n=1 Tax=unclassified Actinoplanes TaxID=2626549 RepID=UPI00023ED1C2|nr:MULTISPECIES: hypothetical protein [unclassified Actinoplanes]AEV82740.1 hypothetical protein ACPL_1843 [Actinoplanes sp. SE50/110]ATO81136.1 hypothetical protein ACWT_1721 [Actinoplanes sp. SE50]SLL98543.1 hypothetical protein ACSP50_1770 [Actinoplanes sp. SE50/110]
MTTLRDQLADLAGSPGAPTTVQAEADLARGRAALRRRRILQSAAGSALVVAVAAAAVGFGSAGGPSGAGTPLAGGTTAAATSAPAGTAAFDLVSYTGKQPAGFSVDRVPAGWEVQGVTESSLTLAPVGAKPHNSAVPQGDVADSDPNSYVGKVAVMLQSVDEHGAMPGKPEKVSVGGREGFFAKRSDAGDGITLFVKQPNGINLEVQVWDGIHWSRDQIVAFTAGIHVNPNAKQGRG